MITPEDNVIKCKEKLTEACEMYVSWSTTGYPKSTLSNMSYELFTYLREALAELNCNVTVINKE